MIIGVDVDGVVADLNTEWLRRINAAQLTTYSVEDITEWDMKCVSRDGYDVYQHLRDPDLYDHVRPYRGALEAIEVLRDVGHRVVFVTSCSVGKYDAKERWLVRHGFLPDHYVQPDFYPANDKSLIRADVLIDDAPHNLETFPGERILIDQPHNRGDFRFPRARNLVDAVRLVGRLEAHPTPQLHPVFKFR